MVQIAYGIGIADPISIFVDSYGTVAEGYTDSDLSQIVAKNFNLRPGMIIKELGLKRPIFNPSFNVTHLYIYISKNIKICQETFLIAFIYLNLLVLRNKILSEYIFRLEDGKISLNFSSSNSYLSIKFYKYICFLI